MSYFMASIIALETKYKSTEIINNNNEDCVDETNIDKDKDDEIKSDNIQYPPCLSNFLK